MTIQILDTAFETLETRNSSYHGLVSQAEGDVANLNSDHDRNVLHPTKGVSKFTIISIYYL